MTASSFRHRIQTCAPLTSPQSHQPSSSASKPLLFISAVAKIPSPVSPPLTLPLFHTSSAFAQTFLLSPTLSLTVYHATRHSTPLKLAGRTATLHSHNPSTDLALLTLSSPLPKAPIPTFAPPVLHTLCKIPAPSAKLRSALLRLRRISCEPFLPAGGKFPLLVLQMVKGDRVVPGWSGAPVLDTEGRVIGVVAQSLGDEVHAIPAWFVDELKRGVVKPVGFLAGAQWQPLSTVVRRALRIGEDVRGIRVVTGGRGGLRRGDVVTCVDGQQVSDRGSVEMRGVGVDWRAAVCSAPVGGMVEVEVWRAGERRNVKVRVDDAREGTRALGWMDREVVLCGDVVFARLSFEYLKLFGKGWIGHAPRDLVQVAFEEEGGEVVALVGFAGGIGKMGWEKFRHMQIVKVDGKWIQGLGDLVGGKQRVAEFANGWVALIEGGVWEEMDGFTTKAEQEARG